MSKAVEVEVGAITSSFSMDTLLAVGRLFADVFSDNN
jgi:hypothetical protein